MAQNRDILGYKGRTEWRSLKELIERELASGSALILIFREANGVIHLWNLFRAFWREEGVAQDCQQDDGRDVLDQARAHVMDVGGTADSDGGNEGIQ